MSRTSLYFSTVQALPDDSVVVGGHLVAEESSPTATLLLHLVGDKWRLVNKIPEAVNALTLGREIGGEHAIGVLGRNGLFSEAIVSTKQIYKQATIATPEPGYLEDVLFWRGAYYVGGAHRQIHRFDGHRWDRLDSNIYAPADVPKDFVLSLDTDGQLYACGGSGFAARLEQGAWKILSAPTNVDLNAVFCASDGRVFFAGGGGLLLTLLPDETWYDIGRNMYPEAIFWDIEEFQGTVYLAAGMSVFRLVEDTLEPVQLPFAREVEIYRMSSSPRSLWLVGGEVVYQFTGGQWLEHISPSNRGP